MNNDFLHLRLATDYPSNPNATHDYIHALDAYSGCSSASTVGSLADQSRRASLSSQSSGDLPGFLGDHGSVRYVTSVPALQDLSFNTGAGYSMSPINTTNHEIASDNPSFTAPSLAFAGFSHVFPTHLTGPMSYQSASGSNSSYPASATYPHNSAMSDPYRSRNPSHSSGMLPPSRTQSGQSPVSPLLAGNARENYTSSTPYLLRHSVPNRTSIESLSRSPFPTAPRSGDLTAPTLSPASSGSYGMSGAALQLDPSAQLSFTHGGPGPPLEQTTLEHQITSADGHAIQPNINARIEKGFFLADQDWTCYRRNYFSVACSFTLSPLVGSSSLYLHRSDTPRVTEAIHGFAMTISAVVDGRDGKPVELVQHTPKRDKGPQGRPEKVKLNPHTAGSHAIFPGSAAAAVSISGGPLSSTAPGSEQYYMQPGEQQTVATFERIQFKSATANNGKRRAAQQYYHLLVELFADLGGQQMVTVASRLSVPMVVRGRSPGHYQDDRRGSASSAGPGGGAGGNDGGRGGGGPGTGLPGGSRGMGDPMSLLGGPGAMLGGSGGYNSGSGSTSMRHSPSSMGQPLSSSSSSTGHLDHQGDVMMTTSDGGDLTMGEPGNYHQYLTPSLDAKMGHGARQAPILPSFSMPSYFGTSQAVFDASDARQRILKDEFGGIGPSLPPPVVPWSSSAFGGRGATLRNLHPSCGTLEAREQERGYYSNLPASS